MKKLLFIIADYSKLQKSNIMRFVILAIKSILIFLIGTIGLYIAFSSQISAFIYNRYEAIFAVEFTNAMRASIMAEESISRRQQISGQQLSDRLQTDLTDLNFLRNEVIANLSAQKTALDRIDTIVQQQSRIPLLEPGLAEYHKKKLSWLTVDRKSLEQFTEVKNIEYRVYDLSNRLNDAYILVKPPTDMDQNVWKENSIKAGAIAKTMLDEIQAAAQENILIPEYEKNLVDTANRTNRLAQLNLRALSGEISWDAFLAELQKLNSPLPGDRLESSMDLVIKWRTVIIDPKDQARTEAYDEANSALAAMRRAMNDAPVLSDTITKFFVARGWLSLPKVSSDEPETETLLASEVLQIKELTTDADVLFVREALTSYLDRDAKACITSEARQRRENGEKLSGLDLFDAAYFKSKFFPLVKWKSTDSSNYVRVIFIDKPDRLFTALVVENGNKRCLQAFTTDDEENDSAVPQLIGKYRTYVFDPQYAL